MLVIGGVLIAPLAWVYSQLAVTMPRSCGDYVFLSRVFHPLAGVSAGTMHLFIWWSGLAALGSFWARAFLPFTFGTLATVFHASFLTTLATDVAMRNGTFIATTFILAVAAAVALGGTRLSARVALWSVIAGVTAIVLVLVELIVHSAADVQRAFDHASGAVGTYARVVGEANAYGWHAGHTFSGTLAALPYAFVVSVLLLAVTWIAVERVAGA